MVLKQPPCIYLGLGAPPWGCFLGVRLPHDNRLLWPPSIPHLVQFAQSQNFPLFTWFFWIFRTDWTVEVYQWLILKKKKLRNISLQSVTIIQSTVVGFKPATLQLITDRSTKVRSPLPKPSILLSPSLIFLTVVTASSSSQETFLWNKMTKRQNNNSTNNSRKWQTGC